MDHDGMVEPFSNKYFPTEFVEHIAGRKVLYLLISGVKFYKGVLLVVVLPEYL